MRERGWYIVNKDQRLAIPSVSIPYGQRFITIDLANQSDILFTAPGNLYLQLTVEQQTSAGAAKGTASALAVSDVKKWITKTPVLAGSKLDAAQRINNMDLYINNIFVNPEVHDIYIKRIGFSLIRVHRLQTQRISDSTGQLLLSNLKWPVETIFLGFRPAVNIASSNPNQFRDWHRLTLMTDNVLDVPSSSNGDVMTDDTVAYNAASAKHKTFSTQQSVEKLTYATQTETVDVLDLQAHGISIFSQYKTAFYRDYMAYTYGGANINTPEDLGAYMMNFCLYPGTYQPSGHINVSRAREFYLGYNSSYISASTPADMIALAIAINFLLISDGSAVLRYST